jgi:hypothetical protein
MCKDCSKKNDVVLDMLRSGGRNDGRPRKAGLSRPQRCQVYIAPKTQDKLQQLAFCGDSILSWAKK